MDVGPVRPNSFYFADANGGANAIKYKVCVGERRGVITERATQETRGRLAQWSRVAVVIVISGHHITP